MIIVVHGPKDKAEPHIQALRGSQIGQGNGCLLVLKPDGDEHKIEHQIEKLLAGEKLIRGEKLLVGESNRTDTWEAPKDLSKLRWKKNPMVLVYGHDEKVLDQFEKVLPGFKKFVGPVSEMTIK
jgi:hypothetical protein